MPEFIIEKGDQRLTDAIINRKDMNYKSGISHEN
jgi:hypothetical protein